MIHKLNVFYISRSKKLQNEQYCSMAFHLSVFYSISESIAGVQVSIWKRERISCVLYTQTVALEGETDSVDCQGAFVLGGKGLVSSFLYSSGLSVLFLYRV